MDLKSKFRALAANIPPPEKTQEKIGNRYVSVATATKMKSMVDILRSSLASMGSTFM